MTTKLRSTSRRCRCLMLFASLLLAVAALSPAHAKETEVPPAVLETLKQLTGFTSDSVHMDDATGAVTCAGHVTASFDKISFKAGRLTYDPKAGTIEITDTFSLRRDGSSVVADDPKTRAILNVKTRALKIIGRTVTTIGR